MPSFLASLDVLLDPFEVGTPRTTIEAFAVGRPVFRFRPSPEDAESLVPADVAPVFLDTSPTSAWTLAEQWYRAREAYYRVCRRTREFAVATFDANRIAEQYSVLYQELLGQG